MLILSAPASNTSAASFSVRMPPPTVKGMNKCIAVRRTVSSNVALPSCGSRDVQEHNFVRSGVAVGLCQLGWIAGIAQVVKFHAFDDTAVCPRPGKR